jgi:hypothetical protein
LETSFDFIVESVEAIHVLHLVVPAEEEEVVRILDLVAQEETDRLHVLRPPIHVVAEEEVVALGGEAVLVEDSQQVPVLQGGGSDGKGDLGSYVMDPMLKGHRIIF